MDTEERRFTFRGTLTEDQFLRIQWVASRKLFLGIWGVVVLALGMILATGGAAVIAQDPVGQGARLMPLLIGAIVIFPISRWQARRQFRATPTLHGETYGQVSDLGLEFNTALSQARFPWDQLVKATITTDMALVFTSPKTVLYLPRTFFTSDREWAGATDVIRRNMSKLARA